MWRGALLLPLLVVACLLKPMKTETTHVKNVHDFMKQLQQENELILKNENSEQVEFSDEEFGHYRHFFKNVARGIPPKSVWQTLDTVSSTILMFNRPNDTWIQKTQGLQWWVVVSPLKTTQKITLVAVSNVNTNVTHHITDDALVLFNITDYMASVHKNVTVLEIEMIGEVDGVNQHNLADIINMRITDEMGPLLVLASSDLTGKVRSDMESSHAAFSATRRSRREEMSSHSPVVSGCNLEVWSVTTQELGWGWIVYPYNLPLNLCKGTCPVPLIHESLNPTNHAKARNIMRTVFEGNKTQGHPEIQCVPISFHTISLLIENEPGSFTYTLVTSNDLSVSRCGCR